MSVNRPLTSFLIYLSFFIKNLPQKLGREATDEFCVRTPLGSLSLASAILLLLSLHPKRFHLFGAQVAEARDPFAVPRPVAPLGFGGYEVVAVGKRMEGEPRPQFPFQAGTEGLDRVGGVNASPSGLWETVEGKQPRLAEVFEELRVVGAHFSTNRRSLLSASAVSGAE